MSKRQALGRGLEAIIPASMADVMSGVEVLQLPIDEIEPNPNQPRKIFDPESLNSLALSIKEQGVLQPILVKRDGKSIELVAGERRLRASKIAGLKRIPAIIIPEKNPTALMFFSLVENLQREDLNPLEEAEAYKMLIDNFGLKQEEIARRVGKSRPAVANAIRLLSLPEIIKDYIKDRKISAGHARALLAAGDEQRMIRLARLTATRGLSVERLEIIARKEKPSPRHGKKIIKKKTPLPAEISAIEDAMRGYLGSKVKIEIAGKGGVIKIDFYSIDDLRRIAELFSD